MNNRLLIIISIFVLPLVVFGQNLSIVINGSQVESGATYVIPFTSEKLDLGTETLYLYYQDAPLIVSGPVGTQYTVKISTDYSINFIGLNGMCSSISPNSRYTGTETISANGNNLEVSNTFQVIGPHDPYSIVKVANVQLEFYETNKPENSISFNITLSDNPAIPVTNISLNKDEISLDVGATAKLEAVVSPSNATVDYVSWYSDDASIASIDDKGIIKAKSYGETMVYAKSKDVTSGCKVVVEPVLAESVKVSPSELTLLVGEYCTLSATVLPSNTTDKTVVWTSSDESIASVSSKGKVTAVGVGQCFITGSCGEVSSFCTVEVNPILPSSVSLDKSNLEIEIGGSYLLTAAVLPNNTTDKTVVWSSSDPSVATVDNGLVRGVKGGIVTITARTINGLEAYCSVMVTPIDPESISLSDVSIELYPEDTYQLYANIYPQYATNTAIIWSSSDDNIAIIDQTGIITAINVGSCIITAETINGIKAICVVKVNPILAVNIEIDKTNISLIIGRSEQLTATILPYNTTDKTVIWTSTNPQIASVTKDGMVTAVNIGTAIIKASDTQGHVSECSVEVLPILAESILLNLTEITMNVGESQTINASVLPEDTTDKTLIWSSTDEYVAKVEEGAIVALHPGMTIITATTNNGVSASCSVHVNSILTTSIELDKSEITLEIGGKETLHAIIYPDDATDKTVVWRSSDESIATVSQDGEVTALSEGVALITAITTDGSYLTANCKLNALAGINSIYTDNSIKINSMEGNILIEGKSENDIVVVSDIKGSIVYVGYDSTISIGIKGLYIIKVANHIRKIEIQ